VPAGTEQPPAKLLPVGRSPDDELF